jgi:hypothetical protein
VRIKGNAARKEKRKRKRETHAVRGREKICIGIGGSHFSHLNH